MSDINVYVERVGGSDERCVSIPGFTGGHEQPITIGSDPGCMVVLNGPGIAALHARVYWLGIHRILEALAEGVRWRQHESTAGTKLESIGTNSKSPTIGFPCPSDKLVGGP